MYSRAFWYFLVYLSALKLPSLQSTLARSCPLRRQGAADDLRRRLELRQLPLLVEVGPRVLRPERVLVPCATRFVHFSGTVDQNALFLYFSAFFSVFSIVFKCVLVLYSVFQARFCQNTVKIPWHFPPTIFQLLHLVRERHAVEEPAELHLRHAEGDAPDLRQRGERASDQNTLQSTKSYLKHLLF